MRAGRADRNACAGVESFEVLLDEKKVIIRGSVSPETAVEKVGKCGRKTKIWGQ